MEEEEGEQEEAVPAAGAAGAREVAAGERLRLTLGAAATSPGGAADDAAAAAAAAATAHFRAFVKRDPWWLLHKATFTIYCASIVFYLPLLGAYARRNGLSSSQVGLLNAVPPLCELLFTPLWTWLSDRGESYRRGVMVGCLLASTFLRCLTGFVTSFGGLLAWSVVTESVATPVMAVLDASTFAALDATVGTARYGWLRAWGAVGWGATAPLAGALVDRYGPSAMFVGLAALTGPAAVLMLYLPHERRAAGRASAAAAWGKLLSADVLLFLGVCFINGVLYTRRVLVPTLRWLYTRGACTPRVHECMRMMITRKRLQQLTPVGRARAHARPLRDGRMRGRPRAPGGESRIYT